MKWHSYNTQSISSRYLFRFLSENHLKEFLKTGNIWFSRSDKFGDRMECVMINDLLKKPFDFNKIESRKRKNLICCFYEGNKESIAFWDKYAKNDADRKKFALRFKRKDLVKKIESISEKISSDLSISNLIHGKIKYKNLIGASYASLEKNKVKYPAFRKEYVFFYEREYRFDILLKDEYKNLGYPLNIMNGEDLDFSIIINPLLENEDYKKCKKVIGKSK
jgi:hypothetical protein